VESKRKSHEEKKNKKKPSPQLLKVMPHYLPRPLPSTLPALGNCAFDVGNAPIGGEGRRWIVGDADMQGLYLACALWAAINFHDTLGPALRSLRAALKYLRAALKSLIMLFFGGIKAYFFFPLKTIHWLLL